MIMIMMVMMFRVMLSMICAMISDVYLFVISFLLSHSGTHVAIAHAMSVRSIAFSDDSQWILSGSDDGTCCIHDVYAIRKGKGKWCKLEFGLHCDESGEKRCCKPSLVCMNQFCKHSLLHGYQGGKNKSFCYYYRKLSPVCTH